MLVKRCWHPLSKKQIRLWLVDAGGMSSYSDTCMDTGVYIRTVGSKLFLFNANKKNRFGHVLVLFSNHPFWWSSLFLSVIPCHTQFQGMIFWFLDRSLNHDAFEKVLADHGTLQRSQKTFRTDVADS